MPSAYDVLGAGSQLASPAFVSWNHLERWLWAVDVLRQAACDRPDGELSRYTGIVYR